jgi:peptidoglycan/xylan/chitin deacetylase (PgdA/CDA1 family)
MRGSTSWRVVVTVVLAACGGDDTPGALIDAAAIDAPPPDAVRFDAAPLGTDVPWSRSPPGGRAPADVPQLVALTFDDNFGLAHPQAVGGVTEIVQYLDGKTNPAGAGKTADFDGAPVRVTFYHTAIYMVEAAREVLGSRGEDVAGRNRAAWTAARVAGHEVGDHTVNHYNGGVVPLDPDDCCRARDWDAAGWAAEIGTCKDILTDPETGIGARADEVIGFRAPFLGYNDSAFAALPGLGIVYDTSLPNCFDDAEDGTNCSWPHTLAAGSPDADVLAAKLSTPDATIPFAFPEVTEHPGLWELPPTTLILPPDEVAAQYGFTAGLRGRVAALAPLPYPTLFEAATGKIAGLDYSLLLDAALTPPEMAAVLKYNLDLHLSGNRSPLIFVAHAHLYTYSTPSDNPDTPSLAVRDARWAAIRDFVEYALAKPEVRLVAGKDVLSWVQAAAASP